MKSQEKIEDESPSNDKVVQLPMTTTLGTEAADADHPTDMKKIIPSTSRAVNKDNITADEENYVSGAGALVIMGKTDKV